MGPRMTEKPRKGSVGTQGGLGWGQKWTEAQGLALRQKVVSGDSPALASGDLPGSVAPEGSWGCYLCESLGAPESP